MNFIELDSIGTIVDDKGICYPAFKDGTPDLNNPCHIMDTENDEWWTSMSCQDCVTLFSFLANTEIYMTEGYFDWALPKGEMVAKANGYNTLVVAALTEGWSIDDYLWKSTDVEVV